MPSVTRAKFNTPRYLEAHPRFDVVRAEAACSRGQNVCLFFSELGRPLGVLLVSDSSPTSVTLEFAVGGGYIRHTFGAMTITTEIAPNGVNKEHKFLRCPGCNERKSVVVFKDTWRCARCHDLRHRSQLVDKHTLKRERLEALQQTVGSGKPHGMHRRTFHAFVTELKSLKRELRGTYPTYASKDHSYFTNWEWRSVPDSLEIIADFPQFSACGDKIEAVRAEWLGYGKFDP